MKNQKKPGPSDGFSLLEVLVATLILAGASATILGQVRQLYDYSERGRKHQMAVRDVVNQMALLEQYPLQGLPRRLFSKELQLVLPVTGRPAARLVNRPYRGVELPIEQGYAPFHDMMVPLEGRWQIKLVVPGLPPELD